jgi:hypothetical protein
VLGSVRIVDNQLAFEEKVSDNITDLLRKRWSYHKRLYQHKSATAFSILIVEVLVEYFKTQEAHRLFDVEYYIKLDDTIMGEIRRSTNPKLARARWLLSRIDLRKQPRRIWSSKSMRSLKAFKERFRTAEDFSSVLGKYCVERLKKVGEGITSFLESDIFVRWGSWSLGNVPGCKGKHPLTGILFYDACFPTKLKQLKNPQEYSLVGIGYEHVEYWIDVYVRHPEQQDLLRPIVDEYFRIENTTNGLVAISTGNASAWL